jgi:hypothetical protein
MDLFYCPFFYGKQQPRAEKTEKYATQLLLTNAENPFFYIDGFVLLHRRLFAITERVSKTSCRVDLYQQPH